MNLDKCIFLYLRAEKKLFRPWLIAHGSQLTADSSLLKTQPL